jgi:adenylate cyclase
MRLPMSPRVAVWALHLALPLLGLWLLLAQPAADLEWRHPPSHFGLVSVAALLNVGLAMAVGAAALRRTDGRLLIVSMVFLSSALFLLFHGLVTPSVLVGERGIGFDLASPIGLVIGAFLAVVSSGEIGEASSMAIVRRWRLWQTLLLAAVAIWALITVFVPLAIYTPEDASAPLVILAIVGVPLYLAAAVRYARLYRRQPSVVALSVTTAFVILAEALVASALARTWRLSWWEWHLLLLVAYGFVAYSAYVSYRREGSPAGLFDGIALRQTMREVQREYAAALRDLVGRLRTRLVSDEPIDTHGEAARLGRRFELTERQIQLLGPTAELLREIDDLFLHYTSPAVATTLWRDPAASRLGGERYDGVTVLFADLRGFTSFSEAVPQDEVFGMLNAYFGEAVPIVLRGGGTVDKFVGDAIMALFGAPTADREHALRAASAALEIQEACRRIRGEHPGWPLFRIGLNSGPVMVGNVGSEQLRNFTAIGDTVNVAARLEAVAEPGQVVIGESTRDLLGDRVAVEPLGEVALKGKQAPMVAYVLSALLAES